MILSVSNIAWRKEDRGDVLRILSSSGIRHIDVAPLLVVDSLNSYTDKEIIDYLFFWKSKNISPIGMQSLFYEMKNINFFSSKISIAESTIYFENIALFSKKLGVRHLVFGCPKQRSFDKTKTSMTTIDDFFKKIVEICENNDLILCLEPNAKEYGCNFLNTTEDTCEYIEKINSKNMKLNFDTSTVILNNNDPVNTFNTCFDHISHVHVSKPMLSPVDEKFIDHKSLSEAMIEKKYPGCVSVEMITKNRNNLKQNLNNAISVLKNYQTGNML
jgi:sugar phosphate isomerase/epimerase